MANNFTIDLYVKHGPFVGHIDTMASNGIPHSYKYQGGSGDGGDVIFTRRGEGTVALQLNGSTRFTIKDITFPVDPHSQLTRHLFSPTNAVIYNKNDMEQEAHYKVMVHDSKTGADIPCDPKIINQ